MNVAPYVIVRQIGAQHGEDSMINVRNIAGLLGVLMTLRAAPTRAADQAIAGRLQLQTQFSLASIGVSAQTDKPLSVHARLGCCQVVNTSAANLLPTMGVGIGYAIDEH
jgi:hypothetical protein